VAPEEGFRRTYTVSEITAEIAGRLEREFSFVWVEGEISGLRTPSSGHIYFSLKDDTASLKCVMFKQQTRYLTVRVTEEADYGEDIERGEEEDNESLQRSLFSLKPVSEKLVPFRPEEGQHVLVMGRIGVYAARGEYQLVAEVIEPVGVGAMTMALERLKEELKEKGYFDAERKKNLPFLPERIAVITSPTGAALFDILKVIHQRHPGARVLVCPTRVQGEGAEKEIAAMIDLVNEHDAANVIICGRGGGSLEDLMPFNTREVADAAFKSVIPIVSAVGHEIDFTILDFTADLRAPTPTAAAEIVVPRIDDLLMTIDSAADRLTMGVMNILSRNRRDLTSLLKQLRTPEESIGLMGAKIDAIAGLLTATMAGRLDGRKIRFSSAASALARMSPTEVLSRGYAVVRKSDTGEVIKDAGQIEVGETAEIRLHSGGLTGKIIDRDIDKERKRE
jgi:exodeoxyribonuclease VII large subunit